MLLAKFKPVPGLGLLFLRTLFFIMLFSQMVTNVKVFIYKELLKCHDPSKTSAHQHLPARTSSNVFLQLLPVSSSLRAGLSWTGTIVREGRAELSRCYVTETVFSWQREQKQASERISEPFPILMPRSWIQFPHLVLHFSKRAVPRRVYWANVI